MRFQWKNYSFELPPGFEIQPVFAPCENKNTKQAESDSLSADSITICRPSSPHPHPFPISENPVDLDPRAAGVTIALAAILAKYAGPPLRHLKQSVRVLPEYLDAFQVVTCEPYKVGHYAAARVHYSFETNFRLDQFIIAWHVDAEIVTATMTIPECDPDKGWQLLLPFVKSFQAR